MVKGRLVDCEWPPHPLTQCFILLLCGGLLPTVLNWLEVMTWCFFFTFYELQTDAKNNADDIFFTFKPTTHRNVVLLELRACPLYFFVLLVHSKYEVFSPEVYFLGRTDLNACLLFYSLCCCCFMYVMLLCVFITRGLFLLLNLNGCLASALNMIDSSGV